MLCHAKNNYWVKDSQTQKVVNILTVVVVIFLTDKIVIVLIYQCS